MKNMSVMREGRLRKLHEKLMQKILRHMAADAALEDLEGEIR